MGRGRRHAKRQPIAFLPSPDSESAMRPWRTGLRRSAARPKTPARDSCRRSESRRCPRPAPATRRPSPPPPATSTSFCIGSPSSSTSVSYCATNANYSSCAVRPQFAAVLSSAIQNGLPQTLSSVILTLRGAKRMRQEIQTDPRPLAQGTSPSRQVLPLSAVVLRP